MKNLANLLLIAVAALAVTACSTMPRSTRTGTAPINQPQSVQDPWADYASVGTPTPGPGVALPPDTALPVRKGN